jgi:endonuclease-3
VPLSDFARPSARRVRAIRDRLRLVYGTPGAEPHGHPIAELVLTVLSQSTNDRNRDVAYFRLRESFPEWEEVRDAPVDEVEEAIRPGGISKVKSARIVSILRAIAPEGPLSLDGLRDMSVPEAQEYLTSLPGVGRKTAACVLLFALGMRDVPVDTHVSRVGTRLGLFRPRVGGPRFPEMHDEMLALTPRGAELELHMNLLRHGRRTHVPQRVLGLIRPAAGAGGR